jgi:hypothetical protein
MITKNRQEKQPNFITHEDLLVKLGYRENKSRGLSVIGIRKNKRETILSVASANHWSISWLQKQLDLHLGFNRNRQHISKKNEKN